MNHLKKRIIHIHDRTHQIRIKAMENLFNNRHLLFAPRRFRFLFESLTVQQALETPVFFITPLVGFTWRENHTTSFTESFTCLNIHN